MLDTHPAPIGRRLAAALLLLLLPPLTWAETLYVADNLRVGVRATPSSKAPSLAVIATGTEVNVLKRKKQFIKVRIPNGVEGWVKSAYFSKDKPARRQLDELLQQFRQLRNELQTLQQTRQKEQARLLQLQQRLATAEQENRLLRRQDSSSPPPGKPTPAQSSNYKPVVIAVLVGLGILGVGFLLGVWSHRRAVTRRLGGISL